MQTRILDLDGSLLRQHQLLRRARGTLLPLRAWGPSLRLACRHGAFRRFEEDLSRAAGSERDVEPLLNFVGSGDFHHVSLALLRRLPRPCNLLVLDNHPDWMRGIPFLHCGTWLHHAARLPGVRRIFHFGGEVDFDNHYRWLAPWPTLRAGRIVVAPAQRRFEGGAWARVPHRPLRRRPGERAGPDAVEELIAPHRDELAARPLYISLDKDVLVAAEAAVNWDCGHLTTPEVLEVLCGFLDAAGGRLAGMDVVGDWSPVRVRGLFRRYLHWTEHPRQAIDPAHASRLNEALNLRLLDLVRRVLPGADSPLSAIGYPPSAVRGSPSPLADSRWRIADGG